MTSYFSQIQYVPDPITGERINVGVVAIDAAGSAFQFVADWRRAAGFGGESVEFLREFAARAHENGSEWFVASHSVDELKRKLGGWHNKIQFSEPMLSVKKRDELLADVAVRILHIEPESGSVDPARPRCRGRDTAISWTAKSLGAAMKKRFGKPIKGLIQRDLIVSGEIESHEVHLGLKNGAFYGGVFALSFETGSPRSQQRDTDAIAFALDDLNKKEAGLDVAVIVIPPNETSRPFERAKHIFDSIDTPMLEEIELGDWSTQLVERLPADILDQDPADHARSGSG
jgi:hypothetical protein